MEKTFSIKDIQELTGLSENQVEKIQNSRKQGQSFIQAAVLAQELSETEFLNFYAQHFRVPVVDPSLLELPEEILNKIPLNLQSKYNCIPFYVKGKYLFLAMSDPEDILAIDDIRFCTGLEPVIHAAAPKALNKVLKRSLLKEDPGEYGALQELVQEQEIVSEETEKKETVEQSSLVEDASQAPVVKMVNLIIMEAIKKRASDIHIEVYENFFRVRFRMDGVLKEVMKPPYSLRKSIVSRLKIMAQLNIAEKRLPQDGRIKVRAQNGNKIEFRVSVLPSLHGEKIVLRLLDQSGLSMEMGKLGLDPHILNSLKKCIYKPYGMFLVTGPTGSGKTTTLYSALLELNKEEVNIVTAEDPVEFSLTGVNQTQISESIGMTFASALRSFLRQDPDIILVGEIRDQETAEIAVKAALTGHLVLSTLHTNDAPSTLNRMLNMGVENFLLASAVNGIMAQRLARTLCPECKKKKSPGEEMRKRMEEDGIEPPKEIFYPVGCPACNQTGYKGRVGIYELLEVTPEIQELVLQEANSRQILNAGLEQGMRTMRQDALEKMKQGLISYEEVLRVSV